MDDLDVAGGQSTWEIVSCLLATLRSQLRHLSFRISKGPSNPDTLVADGGGNAICCDDLELVDPVLAHEALKSLEGVQLILQHHFQNRP